MRDLLAFASGLFVSRLPGTPAAVWTTCAVVGVCHLRDAFLHNAGGNSTSRDRDDRFFRDEYLWELWEE